MQKSQLFFAAASVRQINVSSVAMAGSMIVYGQRWLMFALRFGGRLFSALIAVVSALVCSAAPGAELPEGWTVYSARTPDYAALQCANRSNRSWLVSADSETVSIAAAFGDRGGISRIAHGGGWLEGLDHGEFGGGLWWFDGVTRTKLSDHNVRGFLRASFGTLVFAGLDHLDLRSGSVLVVVGGNSTTPKTTLLADLGESPYAFAMAPDRSVVLVTGTRVVHLEPSGALKTVRRGKYWSLVPRSVAVSPAGVTYVGMRHFVMRLMPKNWFYTEDWLVPADCRRFELRRRDCVCLAG